MNFLFQTFTTNLIVEALLVALDVPGRSQLQLKSDFLVSVPTCPGTVSSFFLCRLSALPFSVCCIFCVGVLSSVSFLCQTDILVCLRGFLSVVVNRYCAWGCSPQKPTNLTCDPLLFRVDSHGIPVTSSLNDLKSALLKPGVSALLLTFLGNFPQKSTPLFHGQCSITYCPFALLGSSSTCVTRSYPWHPSSVSWMAGVLMHSVS